MYPECADLHIDLLSIIANRLVSIHDFISFRGVCKSWRSAATFDNFNRSCPRVPWLMYVSTEYRRHGSTRLTRYEDESLPKRVHILDTSMNKTYKTNNFPLTTGNRYLSCNGWILNISGVDVYLTHPLWRIKIELPKTNTLRVNNGSQGVSIHKMVLSDSPTRKTDLVVTVIWGKYNQLSYCRPGDSSWTVIASSGVSFSDIIYHNRKLYALDVSQKVLECDIHGSNPAGLHLVFSLPSYGPDLSVAQGYTWYLVETRGKLLIVAHKFGTSSCKVFGVDLNDGSHKEVFDLGNKALFLGSNSSLCVELNWNEIRPNCIYFTDHIGLQNKDVNVYRLSNKRIKRFVYRSNYSSVPAQVTWVVPSI